MTVLYFTMSLLFYYVNNIIVFVLKKKYVPRELTKLQVKMYDHYVLHIQNVVGKLKNCIVLL